MDTTIINTLSGLSFGELQEFKNMAVFPLLSTRNGGPEYMTLKEALEKALLAVTEVSAGGSVPELKVINKAEVGVLLFDGEELAGAKQNRVLNTSILVPAKAEVVIPVSCTEQRRWAYTSTTFKDSDTMMSTGLRVEKAKTVAASLSSTGQYRSDQGTVWQGISDMARKARVDSQTGAMKDIYEKKVAELEEYLKAFQRVEGQKGVFVFLDGEVAGLDFVSRPQALEVIYPKLIKSYAMEAVLAAKEAPGKPDKNRAEDFLKEVAECEEKKYESVGKGHDYRFLGKNVVGSALMVEDKVIHLAFFRATESDRAGEMADFTRRRRFRII